MFRKFLIIIVFIGLIFSYSVQAQEMPTAASNERWVCLDAIRCGDCDDIEGLAEGECLAREGANCSAANMTWENAEHTARLKQKIGAEYQVLPNKETYIAVCFPSEVGGLCTTGSADTDQIVYKKDNTSELYTATYDSITGTGYTFLGLFDRDGQPRILNYITAEEIFDEYEWADYTTGGYERKFYALNYADPEMGGGGTSGDAGGQQQATVEFSFASQSVDANCVSVAWDPYGRIFDSQTLEPIKGAKVSLLMKRKDGSFTIMTRSDLIGGAIQNPYTTKEDGIYNFVVPAGDYKIVVDHPDYNFPGNGSNLNLNYKSIYRQIYPSQTGEIIQERPPKAEFRDIPLDSKTISIDKEIKLMEYFYNKQKMDKKSIVEGRVSHPLALINAYSTKNNVKYRLLNSVQADKMGRFKIVIDESKFEKDEVFGEVEYFKIDLTKDLKQTNDSLTTKIAKVLNLDPIPNYIEGYAYDETGKVLPNAIVGVYLKFSNRPYFETKTDEKGYYKISSEHLPFFPYTIRYTATNGSIVKITTTKFIDQNKQFISGQKIDLNVYKDNKGEVITKKPLNNSSIKNENKPVEVPTNSTTNQSNLILTVVILLILIGGVVAIVGVYIIKKNNSQI